MFAGNLVIFVFLILKIFILCFFSINKYAASDTIESNMIPPPNNMAIPINVGCHIFVIYKIKAIM